MQLIEGTAIPVRRQAFDAFRATLGVAMPWERPGLSRADRVIAFLENLTVGSGKFAGERLGLRPFQRRFIRAVYREHRGRRPVRTAVLSTPRKQGKTTLAAALALAHLCGPEREPVDNMASFLHRAAVNAALDVVRSRQSARRVPLVDLEPVLAESAHHGPDRMHAAGEILDWLRAALARLNPRAAQIFVLRFFEGRDNPEIARLLDTTPGTVAVTLSRARDRLEEEFRSYLGGVS